MSAVSPTSQPPGLIEADATSIHIRVIIGGVIGGIVIAVCLAIIDIIDYVPYVVYIIYVAIGRWQLQLE